MKPKANRTTQRARRLEHIQEEGPNWVLIAGGALLSTFVVRLGCKLSRAFQIKHQDNTDRTTRERAKSAARRSGACQLHSGLCCSAPEDDACYCRPSDVPMDIKLVSTKEEDISLPLVKVQTEEVMKDGGVLWSSPSDLLGLPQKPFNHSNCSESPCASESGSDIYIKREVIQKLRQQLQRRDEMIMEMQSQIMDLQNSVSIQMAHSTNLESQIESANRELFDSEREIQRLRKAIADHCAVEVGSPEKPASGKKWQSESANGHTNGYVDSGDHMDLHCVGGQLSPEEEKVTMLKGEVAELKEVIQGKYYLLQSYKEQKVELSSKIKELQLKLNSQVPNIL